MRLILILHPLLLIAPSQWTAPTTEVGSTLARVGVRIGITRFWKKLAVCVLHLCLPLHFACYCGDERFGVYGGGKWRRVFTHAT